MSIGLRARRHLRALAFRGVKCLSLFLRMQALVSSASFVHDHFAAFTFVCLLLACCLLACLLLARLLSSAYMYHGALLPSCSTRSTETARSVASPRRSLFQAPCRAAALARPPGPRAASAEPAPAGGQSCDQFAAGGDHRENHGHWRQRTSEAQRQGGHRRRRGRVSPCLRGAPVLYFFRATRGRSSVEQSRRERATALAEAPDRLREALRRLRTTGVRTFEDIQWETSLVPFLFLLSLAVFPCILHMP